MEQREVSTVADEIVCSNDGHIARYVLDHYFSV